jgi:hypothetical protein
MRGVSHEYFAICFSRLVINARTSLLKTVEASAVFDASKSVLQAGASGHPERLQGGPWRTSKKDFLEKKVAPNCFFGLSLELAEPGMIASSKASLLIHTTVQMIFPNSLNCWSQADVRDVLNINPKHDLRL